MKKITTIFLLLALVVNVFASNAFATQTETLDLNVEQDDDPHGVVTITVKSEANTDVLFKLHDNNEEKGKLLYIKAIHAKDNEKGEEIFKFNKDDLGGVGKSYIAEASSATKTITKTFTLTQKEETDVEPSRLIGQDTPTTPSPQPWVTTGPSPTPVSSEEPNPTSNPDDQPYIDPLDVPIVGQAAKVEDAKAGSAFIDSATGATDPMALAWESTRNIIAVSVETMLANISSKKIRISGSTNQLILKESSIKDSDLKKYTSTEKTLNEAIGRNKITLNRELLKEYIVDTSFSTTQKATITIYKGFIEKLKKVGIETLTINDKNFRVSYEMTELIDMLGDKEFVSFDIDTTALSGKIKKLAVNFDTDKTKSVKISFPGLKGDSKYMAIVDENGNPVGGRYNPATGAIEAKITESGVYQIVNNEKDFNDIKHLSEEMQESIKILAAKGIIEGTSAKEFSPEDSISRAEVAALLLRVLSQVDPNADGGFADVKKSDWFYGTAGSAKAYGMIQGFEDNTFRGNATIAKDQILTVASRILQKEMKYIVPEQPSEWLTFVDSASIADWAERDIALATMANIITRTHDNTIHANENMTRGDAALIIMRLFYKVW